ncbi:protein [Escherichia coli]|uniref:Protein n=1 Tax=Escherichia coli TaxID=562 RepID=A0A376UAE3_ECOLX|nr:protein [Escherichia coli]
MNKRHNPSTAKRCLKEANKIIREHEDTLAGIEATASRSVMACWYLPATTF